MKINRSTLVVSAAVLVFAAVATELYFHYKGAFKKRLIRIAKGEVWKWRAITELSAKASTYLVDYWKAVGLHFTASQMQNPTVQQTYPWSSAFISYLFLKAGAKNSFPYAGSHSGYFQKAKADRNNKKAPLRGFRVSEYAPKPGDIVVYSRESGKGYDTSGYFASHGELVIEKGRNYIKAVGGNVSNKVQISTYRTDRSGKLSGNKVPFFMVIQNNI